MKLKFVLLSALGFISFGCSQSEAVPEPDHGKKELTVKMEGLSSSRAAYGEIIEKDTKDLEKLTLVVEGAGGTVIATREVPRWTDDNKDTETDEWKELTYDHKHGIKITPLSGIPKKVYAFGNDVTVTTENGLSYSTELEKQTGTFVAYYGCDDELVSVSVGTGEDPATQYTAEVDCSPLPSRFQINSFNFKTEGTATVYKNINGEEKQGTIKWSGFDGDLMGVYLNNFYTKYADGAGSALFRNTTTRETVKEGKWLFTNEGVTSDAAAYASYSDYAGQYNPIELLAGQCYGFNFFVGPEIPLIHFDVRNLEVTFDEYDEEIFDPELFPGSGIASIVRYFKAGGTEPMKPEDFKSGTLYNMDVVVEPQFVSGDITEATLHLIVNVSIKDWAEENLNPGFKD